MSAGYVLSFTNFLLSKFVKNMCIHIGVGFCVACSDEVGQCEGLDAWDK